MNNNIFGIVQVIVFVIAIISFLFMVYNSIKCWKEMTPSARNWANFLPFITPFLPSSYNEAGKKYYDRWAVSMFLTVLSFAALFILGDISANDRF